MTIKRRASIRPKEDGWRCVVCRRQMRLIEIHAQSGASGQALCPACIRTAMKMLEKM